MAKSVTKILKFADKNADQQNYTFKFAKKIPSYPYFLEKFEVIWSVSHAEV